MRRFSVLRGCPSCSPLSPGRNPPYLMVWGKPPRCQYRQVYSARENSSVRRQDAHYIPWSPGLYSSPRRQYDFEKFPTSKTARIPPTRRDPIPFTTGRQRDAEAEDRLTWRRLPCPKTTEVRTKEEFKKGRKEEKKRMSEEKEKEEEEEEEKKLGKEEREAVEEAEKEKDKEKKREEKEVKENKKKRKTESSWMLEETEGQGNKKRRMPSSHMQRAPSRTFGDKVEMISKRQTCRSQEENRHPQDIRPHVEATALVCPRKNSPGFGCRSSRGSNGDNSTGAPGSPRIPVPVQKILGKRKAPKLELLLPPSGPLPCPALLQQLWDQGDLPPPPKIPRIDTEKASDITKNTKDQAVQISHEVDALQPMNQMVSVHTAPQPALSSPLPASGPAGFLSLSTDGVSSPGPPASTPLLCQAAGPPNPLVPSPSLTPNAPTIPISPSALPSDLLPPCMARPSVETPPEAKKDPVDLATVLASTTSHPPRSGAEALSFSSPSCRMESPVPMCITDSPSPPFPATSLAPPTDFSTTASPACEDMSWELSSEPAVTDMDTTPPSEAAVVSSPTVSSDNTLPFAPHHGCMQQRLAENATVSTGSLVPRTPCYTHVENNLHTPRPTNGCKQGVSPSGDLAILVQNGLVPVPPTVAKSPPPPAEDFEFMDTTPPSKAAVLPSSTAGDHVSNSCPPPTVSGPAIAYNYTKGTPQSAIAYNYPRGTPQSAIAYSYPRGTPQSAIAYSYPRGTPQSAIAYSYPRGTPQSAIAYSYPRGTPQSAKAYSYPRGTPQSATAYSYPRGTPQSATAYSYPRGTPQSAIAYSYPRGTPQSAIAYSYPRGTPQSAIAYSYPRGTPQSAIAYSYPRGTPQSAIAYSYPRGTPQSAIAYSYPRGTPQSAIAYSYPRGTPQSTHALLNGPQSDGCDSMRNLSTSIAAIDLTSLAGQPAGGSTTQRQYASSKPPANHGQPIGTGRAIGKHLCVSSTATPTLRMGSGDCTSSSTNVACRTSGLVRPVVSLSGENGQRGKPTQGHVPTPPVYYVVRQKGKDSRDADPPYSSQTLPLSYTQW